jgi:hypothetical protein
MIVSLEYHVADHCNLNCAGCSHFSPLAKPWLVDPENFEKEWKEVADSGLEIGRIRILGGEPLLHPELGYMLKCVRCLFPNTDINVVTNGILLKKRKDELLPVFIRNNISLTVSCYPGLNLDYQDLLRGFPKTEMYDKAGFWNISLHENADYPKECFYSCFSASMAKCNFLKDGRIYPCCVIPNLPHFFNYFEETAAMDLSKIPIESAGITVKDHTPEEIEKFVNTPNEFCTHCNVRRAIEAHPWKQTEYKINEWME